MIEADGTRASGRPWVDRSSASEVRVVVLSLMWSVCACGRFGYDRWLREDAPAPDAGSGGEAAGGTGSSGGDGAGSSGTGGNAGRDRPAADGGGSIEDDGGSGAGDAAVGGASAGGTSSGPAAASCSDGLQNGGERGTDCGGADCLPCACAFGPPEVLANLSSPGEILWAPSLSADALTLYAALGAAGVGERVVVTTRPDRGNTFGLPSTVPPPVSQSVEGTPHPSFDGLSLYFYSERGGGAAAARDIYVATRSDPNGAFDTAAPLASVNSSSKEHLPWTSADQLTLYFSSQRSGNLDIWRSTRAALGDAFGAPTAVAELNSSADDTGTTLTEDQRTLIFASLRPNGAGDFDLYQSVRAGTDEPFSTPQALTVLNTGALELDPALSRDGQELLFVSSRNGDNQILRSLRSCP
jgi:WD40 repeat protein